MTARGVRGREGGSEESGEARASIYHPRTVSALPPASERLGVMGKIGGLRPAPPPISQQIILWALRIRARERPEETGRGPKNKTRE